MILVRLIPVILSLLLLAAHFLRSDNSFLFGMSLALIVVLFNRKSYVPRLLQLALMAGTIEWIRTILLYVHQRQVTGEPWLRLVFILGSVALFTAFSAFTFENDRLKKHYHLNKK